MTLSKFCRIKWEQAIELKKRGNYDEAEKELSAAIEEAPANLMLKASLAELYVRQGRLLEARIITSEILDTKPDHPQALVVLGEILFKEKRFKEALNCFRHASRKDQRPYLTLRIARTLRETGDYEEAIDELDRLLAVERQNTSFLKEKALILNRVERYSEALEIYENLRILDPADSFVLKEILRLKGLNRPDNSVVKELSAVVKIPSRKCDAQLHGLLGQELKKTGQVREAAIEYATASKLAPDNLYFLKQQGFCYYKLKEHSRAIECLSEAFVKEPSDFIVKTTLEKIYTTLGRLDDYLSLLERALEAHPHNVKLMGTIKKIKKLIEAQSREATGIREKQPMTNDK